MMTARLLVDVEWNEQEATEQEVRAELQTALDVHYDGAATIVS